MVHLQMVTKKYFILFVFFLSSLSATELFYRMSPKNLDGRSALEIFCEFEGNEEGVTDVIFPLTEGRLNVVSKIGRAHV